MPAELPASSPQLRHYLRLLVVIAAPVCGKTENDPPAQPLDVWGEWQRFSQALKHSRDPVHDRAAPYAVVRLFPPTLENLRHALTFGDENSTYQILHFIGHGSATGLALEDEFGREQFVPVAELVAACKNSRLKLVVLNACETRPLAQALQAAGIPSVIGTHAPIADLVAKTFSETFYSRLALGQSLKTAFTATQEILAGKFGEEAAQNLALLQLSDQTLALPPQPATDFLLLANEPPHNLPLLQYTRHFAGRGPELVQIGQWLAGRPEAVIALSGVGGIGKSSLATMAALRHSHRFAGVIFATAKDDPQNFGVEKIVQTIDAVCGSDCLAAAMPEKRQQAALRLLNSKPLLLVLDNLETLSAAATTALGNFLRQLDPRQGSVALLTLRPRHKDPLTTLAGNCLLPVEALDLFSACLLVHNLSGERLLLKFERRPPAANEKPLLLALAQHLGYRETALPLLAAVHDLASDCHCHPRLVELALGDLRRATTSFAAVRQHLQTLSGKDLQAAVNDMLGRMLTALQAEVPAALALLQTMTIFRGPAEVEALAAVHGSEEPEAFEKALNAAVDSSLLNAENERVWLHSLTAQFLEKHAPLPAATAHACRRRHAEYYLAKARQYKESNMEHWRAFDVDWDNIAAAAEWVATLPVEEKAQAELVGDFARAVTDVVYWRKLPAEKWLLAGATAFVRLGNKKNEALMYNQIGLIYDARGDYDAALAWYQKSVEIQEALGDRAGLATSYNNIGEVHRARGDYDAALAWYQKSVAIEEALGDRAGLARSYNNIGGIYHARGEYDAALAWYQKSREILEALGDRAGLAITLHNMGYVAKAQQDWPAALAYFTRSRELYQQLGLEKDVHEEEALIAEVQAKM
ncbi:MAG: tetratricopeptide repeat protein [candidate division KSB1 bacterium]|nr:tetratricopeptide repeat protein [candidate division KSB1 bacterium]